MTSVARNLTLPPIGTPTVTGHPPAAAPPKVGTSSGRKMSLSPDLPGSSKTQNTATSILTAEKTAKPSPPIGEKTKKVSPKTEKIATKSGKAGYAALSELQTPPQENTLPPIGKTRTSSTSSHSSIESLASKEAKGPTLPFGEGKVSFEKALINDPAGIKPKAGANGPKEMRADMFIKAFDSREVQLEVANSQIIRALGGVDHFNLKAPEAKLLNRDEKTQVKDSSPKFSDIKGMDVMVAGKVRGVTMGDLFNDPNKTEKFNKNIQGRMEEMGRIAAMDMLTSNKDRLVKFTPDGFQTPQANLGNLMYSTVGGEIGEAHLIDNGAMTGDLVDNDYTTAFVIQMESKNQDQIADHVLTGLGHAITEGKFRPMNPGEDIASYENEKVAHQKQAAVDKFNEGRDEKLNEKDLKNSIKKGIGQAKTAMKNISDRGGLGLEELKEIKNEAQENNKPHIAAHVDSVLARLDGIKIDVDRQTRANPFRHK